MRRWLRARHRSCRWRASSLLDPGVQGWSLSFIRIGVPFSVARISPGRLKVLDDGIFNEPYATVNLALATYGS